MVTSAFAAAEIPCEMNSFKSQQFRWAKGSAQTAKKLLPIVLRAKIPFKVKLEAVFHLTNNFAYVFIVILACLQLPNMLLRKHLDIPELLLLDVPLFAATSGSIVLFYMTTHRVLYKDLWEAVRRLPLMMALGIGLSINNARAVMEGLFGGESEFVRKSTAISVGSSPSVKLTGLHRPGGGCGGRHPWPRRGDAAVPSATRRTGPRTGRAD